MGEIAESRQDLQYLANRLVRIGARACRIDAMRGIYPAERRRGSDGVLEDQGCHVVIQGQSMYTLVWSVAEATHRWNTNVLGLADNVTLNTGCMFDTDTPTYAVKKAELWAAPEDSKS